MVYMRALYELPRLENTHRFLRTFYDSLMCLTLESLRKGSDSYGHLLVRILLDKFPDELRKIHQTTLPGQMDTRKVAQISPQRNWGS